MKLGAHKHEQDISEMSDEYLDWEYHNLILDQTVANAVKAVLLKLEIERRRSEVLQVEAESVFQIQFDYSMKDGD